MYILGDSWQDGYLDYHRPPGHVRIQVRGWWTVQRIDDMFFVRAKDWRLVWNYVREFGVRSVLTKVRSREGERLRNQKVFAIGLGVVAESDPSCTHASGRAVVFAAPCHPPCVERVVLPAALVAEVDTAVVDRIDKDNDIVLVDSPFSDGRVDVLAGWSPFSGNALPDSVPSFLADAAEHWRKADLGASRILPLAAATPIREYTLTPQASAGSLKAILVGLGNYAKTVILSNLPEGIETVCVHEIDPAQVGKTAGVAWGIDTGPQLRADETFDVCFIAGYHHTHTPVAVSVIEQGGWAVVEKPLTTSWEQLHELTQAVQRHPGRLIAGFHMRYNPLWQHAIQDLGVGEGQAIHYHCIVFEVPLPNRHWYRWPNSRSRIVSNGCHWIDHFLYLNRYAEPVKYDLWQGSNDDVHASLELENGAVFGMHLTDHGSSRIGVQDHIELRANGVTVTVDNDSRYRSEDDRRIIRRCRINKLHTYSDMYRAIGERIVRGQEGDDLVSIQRTNETMLTLEDMMADTHRH